MFEKLLTNEQMFDKLYAEHLFFCYLILALVFELAKGG